MSAYTVTVAGGSGTEELIAADVNRDHLTIQLQSAHPAYLGFAEDAVDATGICLLYPGCSVRVLGPKARGAVNVIAAGNAVIGLETTEDVEYRPGSYMGL